MRKDKLLPKYLEKISAFFPPVHLILISVSGVLFIKSLTVLTLLLFVFNIYLLPVGLWVIIRSLYPLNEGPSYIGIKEPYGSMWKLSYHLQYVFISFSAFERILIIIPGAFSFWLRLWGSKIGQKILWTPRIEILDRSLLDIGDFTVFGDKVYLSSHIVKRKNDRWLLFVKKITIGQRVLIGYRSELGPGSEVKNFEMLQAKSQLFLNTIIRGQDETELAQ